MTGWGRLILAVAVAATAAPADPAGEIADPLRWYDPRGTASGSRRSAALPVTGDPEEAWKAVMGSRVAAPPVHWDGRLYLFCSTSVDRELVALDLFDGRVIARKRLGAGPQTKPVVWDHRVYLRVSEEEIGEFVIVGKTFTQAWRHRPNLGVLADPVVFENEIYVASKECLVRLAPGRARPVWSTLAWNVRGRVAILGDDVWSLSGATVSGPVLALGRHRRSNGGGMRGHDIAMYAGQSTPPFESEGEIAFAGEHCYILAPAPLAAEVGSCPSACVRLKEADPSVSFRTRAGLLDVAGGFSTHRDGILTFTSGNLTRRILFFPNGAEDAPVRVLAEKQQQPHLFESDLPPTVLGDVAYFGGWAADLKTYDILWRIPVEAIAFPLVPADRMFVVVEAPNIVRAFRERAGTK